MKYVSQALIEGEHPICVAHFHWIYDFWAVCWLIFGSWFFGFGLFMFLHRLLVRNCTEIVITNQRLVYKRGIIARRVDEMSIDRIEGSNVNQSLVGRMLGFGGLVVHGTGIGQIRLPFYLNNPIAFRKALDQAKMHELKPDEYREFAG